MSTRRWRPWRRSDDAIISALAAHQFWPGELRLGTVSILDARAFAADVVLVSVAAVVASYFPARCATLVNPWTTLRADG